MIRLEGIEKQYTSGRKIKALSNINIEFKSKGMVFISGPSGSGKTTLLNIIGGLLKPTKGNIKFENNCNESMSYIFQENSLLDDLRVIDNVLIASKINNKELSKEQIDEFFNNIGMSNVLKSYPHELSGGQQQRVAIARAVLMESKILLCDEPTASLDEKTATEIMDILKDISKTKLVIIVSHDKSLVEKYADRIISINDGIITSDINVNEIENEEVIIEKVRHKNPILYFSKIGLKYVKFKSLRFYLTILTMIISFTLLFLALGLMMYTPEKAYTNSLDEYNSLTSVGSRNKSLSISEGVKNFTEADIEFLDKYVDDKIIFYSSNYAVSSGFHNYATISEAFISSTNIELEGSLPNENEVMILANIASDRKLKIGDDINFLETKFKISGLLQIPKFTNNSTCFYDSLFFHNSDLDEIINLYKEGDIDYYIHEIICSFVSFNIMAEIENYIFSDGHSLTIDNSLFEIIKNQNITIESAKVFAICIFLVIFVLSLLLIFISALSLMAEKKDDIYVIKAIGAESMSLFNIFIISPIIIMIVSAIGGIVAYNYCKDLINNFIIAHFDVSTPAIDLSIWGFILSIIGLFIISTLPTLLAILSSKKKEK